MTKSSQSNATAGNSLAGHVPSVNGRVVVYTRGPLKLAQIHDEIWQEGPLIENPDTARFALKNSPFRADLFTFAQKLPDTAPRHSFYWDADNLAVADTPDFDVWWESLPQESRKNVRRAERRGVVVKEFDFTREIAQSIKRIYDETPIRQGRRFMHYCKDLNAVYDENATYTDRSRFIGAFFKDELIGFIKMVYVDRTARIMQIIAMNSHTDKRPTNALLAHAVRTSSQNSISHLIYGQFVYDRKTNSPVTEFKRRNGFYQVLLPRYYLPLTWKGQLAIAMRLHRGLKVLLPEKITTLLSKTRLAYYERMLLPRQAGSRC